jgi:prepilin-type N-terminal cleavage/methylation domain-containing protein
MERQRVANSEWRLERQRIATGDWRLVERQCGGRQRLAIGEWRLVKRQQEASRKWRIVSRQSSVANRQSPVATFRLAFTLTELLVAIAILSILFTLLFVPMTTAFDNARRGRIMAELQNAADYALEIMVRELMQATEVLPQERVDANSGNPLNLLDDLDSGDDDTLSRIDFVVRAVKDDRLTPQNYQQAYTVITYYLRRADPSRHFRYLDVGDSPANRRQIFRAHWQPQGTDPKNPVAPEPTDRDEQGRWKVTGAWIMPDLSQLQPFNPQQGGLLSHIALTPPDIDVADLRFTVERRPESDERDQKPVAVVIEMTLRKPTPGAKARRNNPNETEINPNETDVPSIFVRRRVRVVLPNVP